MRLSISLTGHFLILEGVFKHTCILVKRKGEREKGRGKKRLTMQLEMTAEWLRVLAALPEDLSSVPRTQIKELPTTCNADRAHCCN